MKSEMTKKKLSKALKQLMKSNPIEKITVSDVSSTCNVSRMTFYYHFSDIYELLEWTCEQEGREIIDRNYHYDKWEEGFERILEILLEDKDFIINAYKTSSRDRIEYKTHLLVEELLMDVAKEAAAGLTVREDILRQLAVFYAYGLLGMIREWVKNNMRISPHEFTCSISNVMRGSFRRTLENISACENGPDSLQPAMLQKTGPLFTDP